MRDGEGGGSGGRPRAVAALAGSLRSLAAVALLCSDPHGNADPAAYTAGEMWPAGLASPTGASAVRRRGAHHLRQSGRSAACRCCL